MTPINFEDPALQVDSSPFIVMEDTPMSKLHFLFIMLNISQVNVVKKGVITGIITKNEFLSKKKAKATSKDDKKKIERVIRDNRGNSEMQTMKVSERQSQN